MSLDICELFYTKLSKSFKGQKHFQQTLCKRKSHILFQLVNRLESKVEAPLSLSSTICALITGDRNLSLSISNDKTIKTGSEFLQRKVKLLLTEDEISSYTHLVCYIEPLLQCRKQNVKNSGGASNQTTVPRSNVGFFVQMFVILMLI